MIRIPYDFDLHHDIKTGDEIIRVYRDALEVTRSIKSLLDSHINGSVRNNGKFMTTREIDGDDTHNELVRVQQEIEKIDAQN